MGVVYQARDPNCRRSVALKVMSCPDGADREAILRFVTEAQTTAQLEHPGVVPVHDLDVDDDGELFYAMKLVRGRTLDAILQDIRAGNQETVEAYPLIRLLTIAMKTCETVAFAHSKGVVHHDLKPGNVMVGRYGEVLVLDWGIAKVLGQSEKEREPVEGDAGGGEPCGGASRTDDGHTAPAQSWELRRSCRRNRQRGEPARSMSAPTSTRSEAFCTAS
jgi:serine/threonine protein kinase